jgi:mediator of RNA polymerase II transcription subunit 16
MSRLSGPDDVNTVTSMAQAGFTFPADPSGKAQYPFLDLSLLAETLRMFIIGLHVAFSQSGSAAASIDFDGRLHLRAMEHSFGAEDGLYNDGLWHSRASPRNIFLVV